MNAPSLLLETSVVLDRAKRSTIKREPNGTRAASFILVRGEHERAWAINADIPQRIANELDALAREEPTSTDWKASPIHAERYRKLLGGQHDCYFGPSFAFPDRLRNIDVDTCVIDDERLLDRNFNGWVPGEIAKGRAPVLAFAIDGAPVSVCFCARLGDSAAEAGVETAAPYRGRGLAPQVTAAWARAIRERGRIPLYSTSWMNRGSLAVARKLELSVQGTFWSLSPR